ncbi:MAG: class I SAM-dependent DNA methyltransferase [Candidatus Brocadiia bacterium]
MPRTDTNAVNNFDVLAPVYDELVAWAPYELWIENLLQDLKRFGLTDEDVILDAACGTGLSTLPLLHRGFEVIGVDSSSEMLALAREKVEKDERNLNARFYQARLSSMSLSHVFDAAICMHSGLDYILTFEGLMGAVDQIRSHLRTGALFAFDKCLDTEGFWRKTRIDRRNLTGGNAVLNYSWDRGSKIFTQHCYITFTDEHGHEKKIDVTHKMLAVTVEELIDGLKDCGFEVLKPPEEFCVSDPGMGIFRAV